MSPCDHFDVAIIGGGPAGSTAATFLARQGHRVVVLEKERFPRFHIGESLLPFSMPALERMGVQDKIARAGFVAKHGAQVVSGCEKSEVRFYFKNGFRIPKRYSTAYQVPRAEFDHLLLDHARESGAEVREETTVQHLDLHSNPVRVTTRHKSGDTSEVTAAYLLDCSGRHSLVGQQLGLKQTYSDLRKIAIYAHFDPVTACSGIDGTLTRMIRGTDHWFWMIPLSPTRCSIGLVLDVDRFKASRISPEEFFMSHLKAQPFIWERMQHATQVTKTYTSGEYSYRNRELTGSQWVLAGDAAGFIDPIFSSGVFLALHSGERAAEALNIALRQPNEKSKAFSVYAKDLNRVMDLYLRFVRGWYRQEFVETMLNPVNILQIVPAVNAVLAGNLGASFALRWRIWLFESIVRLQKKLPLSPKLTFQPPPA